MSIAKLLYNLGKKLRNPSLNKTYSALKSSEQWTVAELENYQLQKLKELVLHSYQYSKYYRNLYDSNNINPNNITSLNDLKKLPVITKSELILHSKNIQSSFSFKKVFRANTSGTTGSALSFLRNEKADSFNRAAIERGYSWYGVKPWERNGYFWGFNFSKFQTLKTKLLDGLQNRFRLFSYNPNNVSQFAKKLKKAKYLHGYSSMIYHVAQFINSHKLEKPKHLKMVKGTSEKIFDSYKAEILEAFGTNIISEYGAAETGIIAFECPKGTMHINMEGVIVEVINHKIVVTNLQQLSFPIIRYELGDYIKLSQVNTCACGMKHLAIEEITGRIGNQIIGLQNKYPSLYLYYIFKNLDKSKGLKVTYQVIQKEVGVLDFLVAEQLSTLNKQQLNEEITNYFKNDIIFTVKDKAPLLQNNGKFKSFITHLNNNEYT